MRCTILIFFMMVAIGTPAMPIGLRTAIWGGGAAYRTAELDEAFPAIEDDTPVEEITKILTNATDVTLAEKITNQNEYLNFRDWARGVGALDVKSSQTSYLSFATDSLVLVGIPEEGDLFIDDVMMDADGAMEVIFSLKGVAVGSNALEERLKAVFSIEGSTILDRAAFKSDNIGIRFMPTDDGCVKAIIQPPAEGEQGAFFMRVKLK